MKIGILGPIWLNIPPERYGGTEEVLYNLVQGLVKKGHDVTLFGPQTSQITGKLVPTVSQPLREQHISWNDILYHLSHIATAFDHIKKFDILHVHINRDQDFMSFPLAVFSSTPVLFTFHGLLPTKKENPEAYSLLTKYKYFPFTSISQSQRDKLPLNFVQTAYNGIDLQKYPFNSIPDDYFFWLGKVHPNKGTKEAILAAKKAHVKLIVAGVVERTLPSLFTYYKKEVQSLIDGKQIIWVGEVTLAQKVAFLSHAKALLNPIQWEEPFGLVMVESQATGTPVIANNRGSAAEVIQSNKTGFLVDSLDTMVEKMKEIHTLHRSNCRAFIKNSFTVENMVQSYISAYITTIENWQNILKKQRSLIYQNVK